MRRLGKSFPANQYALKRVHVTSSHRKAPRTGSCDCPFVGYKNANLPATVRLLRSSSVSIIDSTSQGVRTLRHRHASVTLPPSECSLLSFAILFLLFYELLSHHPSSSGRILRVLPCALHHVDYLDVPFIYFGVRGPPVIHANDSRIV